jgi:predicted O-methyltransferase YrrM
MNFLEELKEYALKNNVPILREESGHILSDLIKKEKPKKILEIGTAIGYSAILMLSKCEDCCLTTIEKNEKRANEAKQNFVRAGIENRINLIQGDAMDIVEKLETSGEKFDLIFLDGPKGQYVKYLPYLKNMLKDGGFLFADDVYLHGWVKGDDIPPHKHRAMVMALRRFIKEISSDEELETQILDIEDGISISRKK